MTESVLNFLCEGLPLVGILAEPLTGTAPDVGVVIIVGGPQYRAGSHRQFVLLARHLASQGFATLRFDYRGMGDSQGESRDFLDAEADIGAAITALLAARPALKRVVLWGLCDAASAALLYVESTRDTRVAGLGLLNPWVRSAATLAKTHVRHYYWRRLREPAFWAKLLRGGVGLKAWRTFTGNLRLARGAAGPSQDKRSFQERMRSGFDVCVGPVQLLLSSEDYTAKEFEAWAHDSAPKWTLHSRPSLELHHLRGADHTLSTRADHDAMCKLVTAWLQSHWPAPEEAQHP